MVILTILIIGVGFWYILIEKPKEKKEFNKWLNEKKDILNLKQEIKSILNQLSNQITPCSKCSNSIYQVWNINSTLILRCCECKRKVENNVNSLEDIKTIFDSYLLLYKERYYTKNSSIEDYLKNYLEWDFDSVRKGTSYYSVFMIAALKEVKLEVDNNIINKKSRKISQKVKDLVWNRDNGKCVECGKNENLEFDHIIPYSKGGSNTYRNIQLLCESCNRIKSNKIG